MKNVKLIAKVTLGLWLAYTTAAVAEIPEEVKQPEEITGSADAARPADALAPEVTIVDGPKGKVEEFRANGRLYMIKVYPRKGKPYYLVDADGDGMLETRRTELSPNLLIPSWVLFSW